MNDRVRIAVNRYKALQSHSGKAGETSRENRLHRFLDTLNDAEFREYAIITTEYDRACNEKAMAQ